MIREQFAQLLQQLGHTPGPTASKDTMDNVNNSKNSKKRPIDYLMADSSSIRAYPMMTPQNESKFTTKQALFYLWEQPEESQRKAYKNENRYILPNPLTISLIKPGTELANAAWGNNVPHLPSLKDCVVSVRLVHGNGEELEDNKQNILEGVRTKALVGGDNDYEKKSEFSLKVLETSGRSKFRLLFTINFSMEGYRCEETILSNPFKVISNKKKNAAANTSKPKLSDLIPKQGFHNEAAEVWIRGNFFTDRANMIVKFGDREARITETEENLITCLAPPRPELMQDMTVQVTVSNIHPTKGHLVSVKPLQYEYVMNTGQVKPPSSSREDATTLMSMSDQQHSSNVVSTTSTMNTNHSTNVMNTTPVGYHPAFPFLKKEDMRPQGGGTPATSSSMQMHNPMPMASPHLSSSSSINSSTTSSHSGNGQSQDSLTKMPYNMEFNFGGDSFLNLSSTNLFKELHMPNSKPTNEEVMNMYYESKGPEHREDPFFQRTF